jgi:hypothetical protein
MLYKNNFETAEGESSRRSLLSRVDSVHEPADPPRSAQSSRTPEGECASEMPKNEVLASLPDKMLWKIVVDTNVVLLNKLHVLIREYPI